MVSLFDNKLTPTKKQQRSAVKLMQVNTKYTISNLPTAFSKFFNALFADFLINPPNKSGYITPSCPYS